MINKFKTLQQAVDSWHWDKCWMKDYWIRNKRRQETAAVCYEDGRYFIIVHPECVKYRERVNQVEMYLTKSYADAYNSIQYLDRESVYTVAMDYLDLSNPGVDQEMRMAELMDMVYVGDLELWFDPEGVHERFINRQNVPIKAEPNE